MYCKECIDEINKTEISGKDWVITFILSFFMGLFGIHRFYTGYIGIGIAQALTLGGFGIWSFVDFVSICINKYKDSEGKKPKDYVKALGIGALSVVCAFIIFIFVLFTLFIIALRLTYRI